MPSMYFTSLGLQAGFRSRPAPSDPMHALLPLSLVALTLAASPNEEFALQEAQLILKSGQTKELEAKLNRDVAVRFSHAAEPPEDLAVHSSPPPEDPATHSQRPPAHPNVDLVRPAADAPVHLEDVHVADEVAKHMQQRVEAILAVRQLAWSKTRARLAAAFNGEGANASPLLNEETAHINEIEKNLTETNAELELARGVANLTLAAYTAQTLSFNSSEKAAASKAQAERDAESARAAARAEIVAKDALKAEEAKMKHWRARHG